MVGRRKEAAGVEVAAVEPVRGAPLTAETRGPQGAQALLEGAAMERGSRKRRSEAEQRSPSATAGNLDSSSSVPIRSHLPSICRLTSSIWPLPLGGADAVAERDGGGRGQSAWSSRRASPVPPPSPPSWSPLHPPLWRRPRYCGGEDGRGRKRPRGWRRRPGKEVAAGWRQRPGKRRWMRGGALEAADARRREERKKMKAVVITRGGGPEVLEAQEVEDPAPLGEGEVLLEVAAAGVNRADTLQRHGRHPPPAGAPPYPGLECSGTILALGPDVPSRWSVGDKVCALLSGGGYAEKVVVPAGQLLPVPEGVSLTDAAGLPEVACTVWSTVFMTSHLSPGESFLIHGGSSGIGTFAIQIAKHLGIKVFVTAGSEEKLAACKGLGADLCIDYKTEDFVERVKQETNGKGVDVILDNIGGSYLQRNLNSLGVDGRLFIIGFQGGAAAEVNLQPVLARCLTIQAAGLRGRSLANKAQIVSEVEKNVWPAVAAGKVKPVIYKTFPLSEAAEAHRLMETSTHIGKILLLP